VTVLTPLAFQNADLLRTIAEKAPGRVFSSVSALARQLGRDESNLRKSLRAAADAGLIAYRQGAPFDASLTESGVQMLAALDRAAGDAPAGELLRIAHHHLRPNPLNPRTEASLGDLAGLADTISAAGDVLQNLVVFPADAEGVHTIAAGERRWRAIGLLIERGDWSADRGLPCVVREHDETQTDFVALVENGQRQNLSMIEQARAYARLVEAQGWSAREAALRTGRDPRTVQEMLKVLREAEPQMIRWCDEGRMTWEELRGLVRTPKTPEPPLAPAEPEQRDIEEIAPAPAQSYEQQRRERIRLGCEGLSAKALMVLVETVDKAWREPAGYNNLVRQASCVVGDACEFRSEAGVLVGAVGFSFASRAGDPTIATASDVSVDWLIDKGLHTAHGDRDAILKRVRMAAVGEEKTWAAEHHGRYVTPWLNVPDATEPAERPGLTGDAFSRQLHAALDDGDDPPTHLTEPPAAIADQGEDEDEAEAKAAAETLAKVREGLASGCFGPQGALVFRELLELAGLAGPFRALGETNYGLITAGDVQVATVDQTGELPDDLALAQAELIAFAVNAFAGYSINAHRSAA
jgi:ParB/RepB/Spo0J family partition protein